jgi:hypothetical protein
MVNQYCIFPIGRMENVEVDVARFKMTVDFKVIEIMGDKEPYLALLGIDWEYENYVVIDLKRDTVTFDANGIKVVQSLDLYLGLRYTKLVDNNIESKFLDQLYTIRTMMRLDYINPTIDGYVSWRSIQSVDEDLELDFDSWRQGSYKIFSIHLKNIMEMIWIGNKIRNHPTYDGTSDLDNFLTGIEGKFARDQRILVFYIALKDTPNRWWATHSALILYWENAKRDIRCRFINSDHLKEDMSMDFQGTQLFDG